MQIIIYSANLITLYRSSLEKSGAQDGGGNPRLGPTGGHTAATIQQEVEQGLNISALDIHQRFWSVVYYPESLALS